ncbi:hypothetical protein [Candidatus Chromulinivorax destructor]|uniref:Uncharacterized protein n=1 Tax=Candidatus Chromulinivorax destructor TaxID=2066483 RepID=A0A345ZCT6_9BACT|nr:hypothetical protein [Candidatus Chromulinivorax destructor]AXK61103.1 hypothetical protein C0J27_05220 [Candidatus Chromulinivorax destructor]
MKNFTTKLSTLALCAFVISSSVFAHGKTTVHINVPDATETNYFDNKKGASVSPLSYHFDSEYPNKFNMELDPSSVHNVDIRHVIQDTVHYATESKKSRPNTDFKGYAQWNWIFDKDYNETRQGLDSDGKTVLCEEKNGVVSSSKVKTYGANTCARG